jgi:hypothetical protein
MKYKIRCRKENPYKMIDIDSCIPEDIDLNKDYRGILSIKTYPNPVVEGYCLMEILVEAGSELDARAIVSGSSC